MSNGNTIWFTSDTHFNHESILTLGPGRPFVSIEDMNETIIQNWNDRVKPGDRVYHLGDFMMTWGSKCADTVSETLNRLNGSKFLIIGNHDRKEVVKCDGWAKTDRMMDIKSPIDGTKIVLCHYSLRTWNAMHHGSIQLYGHSHGNLPQPPGKTMDVGVDCHNFAPISIDQVHEFMKDRPIHLEGDHHDG